jgi:hypothetical protein
MRCPRPASRPSAGPWAPGPGPGRWADYLEAVLWTVQGWAGWCAYLGWQAQQQGGQDEHLRDLLAIRLAWGALLVECKTDRAARGLVALQQAWQHAPQRLARAERRCGPTRSGRWRWSRATSVAWRRRCGRAAAGGPRRRRGAGRVLHRRAQRTLRRALEAVWPAVQTAGSPASSACRRPTRRWARRCAARSCRACWRRRCRWATPGQDRWPAAAGGGDGPVAAARQQALARAHQQGATSRWPGTAFSYVEAAGLGYLGGLFGWLRPSPRRAPGRSDGGVGALPAAVPAHAHRAVRRRQVAWRRGCCTPWAWWARRRPGAAGAAGGPRQPVRQQRHSAGLDCGACCGQTGEVNARALAQLLNARGAAAGRWG